MAALRLLTRLQSFKHNGRFMSSFSERQSSHEAHAAGTMKSWKRLSLFVAVPFVSYLTWKNLIAGSAHEEPREYFAWPHMRIRNKPFPWGDGDKSLFHNPHTNPAPLAEGEEEEGGQDTAKESLTSTIGKLWIEYLFEDPEERDRKREAHLAAKQQRHFDYSLAKRKDLEQFPLQPMDLMTELENTPPNHVEQIN